MKLNEFIKEKRPVLEQHILRYLNTKRETSTEFPFLNEWIDKMSAFVVRGKLLRGLLVLLSYEACSGKKCTLAVLDAATGIEMTHSALLIHDDIMDNDLTRRGQPTIFTQYSASASEKGYLHSDHYGRSMGICAGDIGFFFGYELLVYSSQNIPFLNKIHKLYAKELYSVVNAQMADVHHSLTTDEPDTKTILNIYRYKTGRYTFSLPLMIGGLQAECDETTLTQLNKAGELLGVVFQMVDDMIGLIGNEEEIGKPKGSDIRENKKTFIRKLLLENVSDSEKKKLLQIFGNAAITEVDIDYVGELVKHYHINDEILKQAATMTKEARQIIEKMNVQDEYKDLLHQVAEYNLTRVK